MALSSMSLFSWSEEAPGVPMGWKTGGLSSPASQNLPWQQVCLEEMWMASAPFSTSLPTPELKPKPLSARATKQLSAFPAPLPPAPIAEYLSLVPVLLHVQWLPCPPLHPRLQVLSVLMVSALCILLSSRLRARHLVNLTQQLPRGKVHYERVWL